MNNKKVLVFTADGGDGAVSELRLNPDGSYEAKMSDHNWDRDGSYTWKWNRDDVGTYQFIEDGATIRFFVKSSRGRGCSCTCGWGGTVPACTDMCKMHDIEVEMPMFECKFEVPAAHHEADAAPAPKPKVIGYPLPHGYGGKLWSTSVSPLTLDREEEMTNGSAKAGDEPD